jgi:triphosphatase
MPSHAAPALHQLVSDAFEQARERMASHVAGTRDDRDPEHCHKQRVALRKLRVYLGLCRGHLPRRQRKHLSHELRWIFRKLGLLRDDDVFLTQTLPQLKGANELGDLHAAVRQQRSHNLERVRRALQRKRHQKLCKELERVSARITQALADDPEPARAWLTRQLTREHACLLDLASRPPRGADIHALRKQLKRVRYTAELSEPYFARARVQVFLARLEALQDILGAWNDAREGEAILDAVADDLPPAARASAERYVRRPLHEQRQQQSAALTRQLENLPRVEPFWTSRATG